jgi:hypothetical protein
MGAGTWETLSTPEATKTSPSPALIACAADRIDWSEDEQARLTVSPGTVSGRPASSAMLRAMPKPCCPSGTAHPVMTSSMAARSRPGSWSSTLSTTKPPRSSGRSSFSEPLCARPMGVRPAATITASVIVHLVDRGSRLSPQRYSNHSHYRTR